MELARARVADADRNDVIERLNEQHACGRLDLEEFDVRVSAALDAHTFGELHRLVSDLPPRSTVEHSRNTGGRGEDWLARQAVPTLLPAACMAAGGFATTTVTGSGDVGLIAVAAGICGLVLGRLTSRRK